MATHGDLRPGGTGRWMRSPVARELGPTLAQRRRLTTRTTRSWRTVAAVEVLSSVSRCREDRLRRRTKDEVVSSSGDSDRSVFSEALVSSTSARPRRDGAS